MMPLTSSSSSGSNVTERRDGEARGEEAGNDVMVGKKKNTDLSITITVVLVALVAQNLEILQIFPYSAAGNGQQRPLKGWKTHKKILKVEIRWGLILKIGYI